MEQCSTMIKSSMLLPDHGNYFDYATEETCLKIS